MKETMWQRSRMAYKKYNATKRNLFNAHKRMNSTYYHLEAACKRYMSMQSQVFGHLEVDQQDDLQEAYNRFRQAKLDHDASRHALSEAFAALKKIDIGYAVIIFKGLRHIGIKMTNIAKVFGFTSSTMSRWINSSEDELIDHYNGEYGISEE